MMTRYPGTEYTLTKPHGSGSGGPSEKRLAPRKPETPGWADGLRKLYDDVVSEPLPDSFNDLLKKLDQAGDD